MTKVLQIAIIIFFVSNVLVGQEADAILCADGIDNDNDGLIDCEDLNCLNLTDNGCSICVEGISYADVVLEYYSGCPLSDPYPEGSLGLSDYDGSTTDSPTFTFLGQGGYIKLGFVNNIITNSGNSDPDIYVFEVGPVIEAINIALKPMDQTTEQILISQNIPDTDNDGFYEIGLISGSLSSIDLDETIQNQSANSLSFDAIQITDVIDQDCGTSSAPGADIDAVCALSFIKIDCMGIVNGNAVVDDCGECLDPGDPNFNQSCIDCMGTVNGNAVVDDCGECLDPDDPNFNQSCIDCMGIMNGNAVVDDCGECLDPGDPNFNQSCIDCMGTVNGNAVVDDCGECLDSGDPNFNQSCIDCMGIVNGNAVIDDCGECLNPGDPNFNQSCNVCNIHIPNIFMPGSTHNNDVFRIYSCPEFNPLVESFSIYDRWGNLVFNRENLLLKDENCQWDGLFNNILVESGVYVYKIIVKFPSQENKEFIGDVTMIKNY